MTIDVSDNTSDLILLAISIYWVGRVVYSCVRASLDCVRMKCDADLRVKR